MDDQAILDFCAVTNASTDVAEKYLLVADGNVETAVTLYLESGGQGDVQTESRVESSSSSPRLDNAMADEEFARQLQREERQRQQPQVRSPIAARHDILTGSGPLFEHNSLWNSGEAAMINRSVFNQGDSSSGSPGPEFVGALDRRQGAGNGAAAVMSTPRTRRLADLYRPPFDIMFAGGFEEARAAAREQNKWLLVNVQTPSEFACQILNRDVWSDSAIKEIIRESFVFLQYARENPEGQRYTTYYPVKKCPHIAVIDARTGERVKVWEDGISGSDFIMEVTEFLEQGASDNVRLSAMKKKQKTARNVSDMSEEEQINAAIAASLHGAPAAEKAKEDSAPQAEEEAEQDDEQPTEQSVLDSIQPVKREETTDMANSTRIQLRMPDGQRIIRRFLKTDPVRHLFEFVKAEVPETQSKPFELVFNRKQLIESLDQPIQEAGLVNAAVNFVFT